MSEKKLTGELTAYGDSICSSFALPSAGSSLTSAFTNAGILPGIELVVKADTAITVSSGTTLDFVLYECASSGGSFTKAADMANITGPKSIASGAEILRFVPVSTVKRYMKICTSASGDLSAAKISVYPVHKG